MLSLFIHTERIDYIEYWKQANLPVCLFNIRISGKIALYVNVVLSAINQGVPIISIEEKHLC
jgi:hypothetical protein